MQELISGSAAIITITDSPAGVAGTFTSPSTIIISGGAAIVLIVLGALFGETIWKSIHRAVKDQIRQSQKTNNNKNQERFQAMIAVGLHSFR